MWDTLSLLLPPFLFGAIGGISSWIMYFHKFASNHLKLVYKWLGHDLDNYLKTIKSAEASFLFKSFFVYSFVGGIAGIIAINTFNTSATGFPLFSISVIAGLSGMTFLKRSSLVDDLDTKELMNVSYYDFVENTEIKLEGVFNEVDQIGTIDDELLDDLLDDLLIDNDLNGSINSREDLFSDDVIMNIKAYLRSEGFVYENTDENLNLFKKHVTVYLDGSGVDSDLILNIIDDSEWQNAFFLEEERSNDER